jgi:hypothetical protein
METQGFVNQQCPMESATPLPTGRQAKGWGFPKGGVILFDKVQALL